MPIRNPQINIRLKPELKELLHEVALKNKESVNSEIVSRLEASLLMEKNNNELLTAVDAKKIADHARINRKQALFDKCIQEISKAVNLGITEVWVELLGYEDSDLCEGSLIFNEVIKPVEKALLDLGYSVDLIDELFRINF